jgi:hypothetical protein
MLMNLRPVLAEEMAAEAERSSAGALGQTALSFLQVARGARTLACAHCGRQRRGSPTIGARWTNSTARWSPSLFAHSSASPGMRTAARALVGIAAN